MLKMFALLLMGVLDISTLHFSNVTVLGFRFFQLVIIKKLSSCAFKQELSAHIQHFVLENNGLYTWLIKLFADSNGS